MKARAEVRSFHLLAALMLSLTAALVIAACANPNGQPSTYQPSAATTATPPPGGLLNRQTGPGMGGRY